MSSWAFRCLSTHALHCTAAHLAGCSVSRLTLAFHPQTLHASTAPDIACRAHAQPTRSTQRRTRVDRRQHITTAVKLSKHSTKRFDVGQQRTQSACGVRRDPQLAPTNHQLKCQRTANTAVRCRQRNVGLRCVALARRRSRALSCTFVHHSTPFSLSFTARDAACCCTCYHTRSIVSSVNTKGDANTRVLGLVVVAWRVRVMHGGGSR